MVLLIVTVPAGGVDGLVAQHGDGAAGQHIVGGSKDQRARGNTGMLATVTVPPVPANVS